MNSNNLSVNSSSNLSDQIIEFNLRRKLASICNRIGFLKQCIDEQVLPKSAPRHLYNDNVPFTKSARLYLEEACEKLRDEIVMIQDKRKGTPITAQQKDELKRMNEKQTLRLGTKLKALCQNSMWKTAGRSDIVTNLSSRELSEDEREALSLGYKFSSGKDSASYVDHLNKNYKYEDSYAEKGFVQGVIACCKALADKESSSLPKRYHGALETLAKDITIVITQADKGGGIIIMDKVEYIRKMEELLSDTETYQKKPAGDAKREADKFNKAARKILRKSEKGKRLQHLLEENPKAPQMRGLPKVHKPGTPMRPITSGIGSAPHRLAKVLAKPLSRMLGSLSDSHLRNSGDLLERLGHIDMENKKLASFDVKALFTNVTVDGAMEAIEKVLNGVPPDGLPIPKADFIKLVKLCLHYGSFTFNDAEYAQHQGLAMGSPLSPVAASFYMEMMENDHFMGIIGDESCWMRYVDDVIVITPEDTDLDDKLARLNDVEPKIQFTIETEEDKCLPFLDTLIMRTDNGLKFKVYRKDTNKEDYIHYYSAHNGRVKSGVIIGFYLRAYRICSDEFLKEELAHIQDIFRQLKYPKAMIVRCKQKARKIRSGRPRRDKKKDKIIVVPDSKHVDTIRNFLRPADIAVVSKTGKTLGQVVKGREKGKHENSIVYKIPCNGCYKPYYGETGRSLKVRLKEHKHDLRHQRPKTIVKHSHECGALPDWDNAGSIKENINKQTRIAIEAAVLEVKECMNPKTGRISLAETAAKLILAIHNLERLH